MISEDMIDPRAIEKGRGFTFEESKRKCSSECDNG